MSWVKWSQWGDAGMLNFGQMPKRDVAKHIAEFGAEAAKILEKTGADHVVYALKVYDENDELSEVKFYMEPMDDERFQKDVATLKGVVVYAAHALRGDSK